ncbi:hypothetical protein [Phytomonospora endophytica]|uniref:Uncharacterized protein n=1 Tax=Phytomonospora endophytica TaxID=714109 RepID=A0A841FUH9_9ACTN|nr:hypothetical protein [Phytomonospora endophytica]MBB6040015.1 hypothetical protein [Phytomonospora endophytica]GIG67508.1 hypothetical protein Pen01_38030 [Phytomonospora endophytica]
MDTGQQHYLKSALPSPGRFHRPLLYVAGLMALTGAMAVVGLIADDRTLTNMPIWAKPLKFSISIGLYALTMAYLVPLLRKGRKAGWWLGTVIAVMLFIEMVVIVGQVFRGRPSHFNEATPFDAAMWATMGASITVMWLANLGVAIFLAWTSIGDRALTRGIRWGMGIGIGGLAVGYLMARQDTSHLENVAGAHSVGLDDGGPSMPLVGWSTVGGDLRIAHFVGIHAMQVLPLLALWLGSRAVKRARLADEGLRSRVVLVAALGYAGLTLLVLWQALRGESLIHPGATTLTAAGVLVLATGAGLLLAARGGGKPVAAEGSQQPVEVA